MKIKLLTILFLTSVATVSNAAVSMDNEEFKEATVSVYELKSKRTTIILTADCRAYSTTQVGQGKWSSDNGGYIVVFPKKQFVFGRQEVAFGNGKCVSN